MTGLGTYQPSHTTEWYVKEPDGPLVQQATSRLAPHKLSIFLAAPCTEAAGKNTECTNWKHINMNDRLIPYTSCKWCICLFKKLHLTALLVASRKAPTYVHFTGSRAPKSVAESTTRKTNCAWQGTPKDLTGLAP